MAKAGMIQKRSIYPRTHLLLSTIPWLYPNIMQRVMKSFKKDQGIIRVVIATSASSMGVNFPDVKYIIHAGPARSQVDHIQKAGRAGRNREKAHDVTIFRPTCSMWANDQRFCKGYFMLAQNILDQVQSKCKIYWISTQLLFCLWKDL